MSSTISRDVHHFNEEAQNILNSIIKQMAESKDVFNEKQTQDIVDKLCKIYEELNLRHSYSQITKIVIEYCKDEKTELTDSLQQNLNIVLENISSNAKNTELFDCVWKLYDHINMEIYRWNHYRENTENISELTEEMKACTLQLNKAQEDYNFSSKVSKVYNEVQQIKKQYKDASRKLIYANKSAKSLHTQLVSVLGVFSAIILSFFGGFSYFTSIFSNIEKIPVSKAILITSIIGLVMYNVIIYLLKFIAKYLQNLLLNSENDDTTVSKMQNDDTTVPEMQNDDTTVSEMQNNKKKKCDGKYIWSNVAICILIVSSLIWYITCDYNKGNNEQNKSEQSQTEIVTEADEKEVATSTTSNLDENICIKDLNK